MITCGMKIKYKEDTKEIDVYPYTFEDALIFSNIELFRQEKLGNMGAVTTISNLLKSNADLKNSKTRKLQRRNLLLICFLLSNLEI